jgi:hypothetical protein
MLAVFGFARRTDRHGICQSYLHLGPQGDVFHSEIKKENLLYFSTYSLSTLEYRHLVVFDENLRYVIFSIFLWTKSF